MKKVIFTVALIAFSFNIFAQSVNVYAPTLVSPTNSAINQMPQVLLDWSAVSGAISYSVQLDTSSSFSNPSESVSTQTIATVSELLFGTKYYWRVKAVGANETSAWSLVRDFTVLPYFNLVTPIDSTLNCFPNALLKWSSVTGCTYFDYELDTSASFSSPLLISSYVNGTSHQVNPSNLYFGTKYFWRVRGRHSKDTSAWSPDSTNIDNYRCLFTMDALGLTLPLDNATDVRPDVMMKWVAVSGITKYEYQTDTSNQFNSPKLFSGFISSTNAYAKADTLDFATMYYWRVRAIHQTDTNEWSLFRQYTVLDHLELTTPTNGQNVYTATPILKWTKITGVIMYELEIDTVSGFTSPTLYAIDSSATQKQVNITLGNQYFWRMRAISSRDTSSWSSTWSFNVPGVGIDSYTLNSFSVKIFPNPAQENTYLEIKSDDNTKINVVILDILGNKISEVVYDVASGKNMKKLNLEGLANGIYLLKFTDKNNSSIKKLTISR